MRASKIFVFWIVFCNLASTFYYSILVLYKIYTRQWLAREQIDDFLRRWSSRLLSLIKLNYSVVGKEHCNYLPGRCYIIMSNHASMYDIPIIFCTMPGSIRMLAKRELFKVPIWGKAMGAAEFLSISRGASKQAVKDLQLAQKKMEDGIILWVSPEGTRSRTGKLLPFKRGGFLLALQTKAIIIPVGIRGAGRVLPPDTLTINLYQKVDVSVGEPIDTKNYDKEHLQQLMDVVAQQITTLSE
jgi:1-acyl-sn-glycerol-3-phosphate acyltransferase